MVDVAVVLAVDGETWTLPFKRRSVFRRGQAAIIFASRVLGRREKKLNSRMSPRSLSDTDLIRTDAVRRSRSIHDGALQAIGSSIVRGDYPAGSLLPRKEELMVKLEVSHTTIRETLQTLSAKGMIAARANVGTRVLEQSHWNMFDPDILAWRLEKGIEPSFLASLFEIRQSLEPLAAALMAMRGSDQDIARLRELANKLEVVPDEKVAFVSADIAFHRLIVEASANPFMQSVGAVIDTALTASFMLSAPTAHPDLSKQVRLQHLEIVEAIAARDPQRANNAMMEVIQQGWRSCSGSDIQLIARANLMVFLNG